MATNFSLGIVTGADGFIARALIARLRAEPGMRVIGLAEKAADVSSLEAVLSAFPGINGEEAVLFHMAGIASASACRQDPVRAFAVNAGGTVNIIEACRRNGVKRIVFPSTSYVYGTRLESPATEQAATSSTCMYVSTKLSAEAVLEGAALEYGLSCDVARLGNVYGFGSLAETVHGTLLRQAVKRQPLSVQSLTPVRDFIFIEDVAEGLFRLASLGGAGGFRLFNLASGAGTSIKELASIISGLSGCEAPVPSQKAAGGMNSLVLDIGKLKRHLGWSPGWSIEKGLARTFEQLMKGENS